MSNKNNGLITLSNEIAECKISLFGGNIVSYRPKTEDYDVFWLGDLNKFDNIQAIRGGVPVCWPRFAEEELNNNLPRHGFARLSTWNLDNVCVDNNKIETTLSLNPDSKFDVSISAKLFIKITDKLEYRLETINHGDKEFKFSEALHAYFYVGNLDNTIIQGLSGHQYRNSLDGEIYFQAQDLVIKDEFDSSFINHTGNIKIVDEVLHRTINIEKDGSNTTVVWNPNKDLAEMTPNQYKTFICVEPANQGDSFITLAPKAKHSISMRISITKDKY